MIISADNMGGIQNVRISDIHLNGACNSIAVRRPSTLRGGCEAFGMPALSTDDSLCVRTIMPTPGTIEEPMGGLQVLVRLGLPFVPPRNLARDVRRGTNRLNTCSPDGSER